MKMTNKETELIIHDLAKGLPMEERSRLVKEALAEIQNRLMDLVLKGKYRTPEESAEMTGICDFIDSMGSEGVST